LKEAKPPFLATKVVWPPLKQSEKWLATHLSIQCERERERERDFNLVVVVIGS